MIFDKKQTRRSLERSFAEIKNTLPEKIQSEMAIPSYLAGNSVSRWVAWKKIEHTLRMCGDSENLHIMDYGCGTGILLGPLSGHCARLYGVDVELDFASATCTRISSENVILLEPDAVQSGIPDQSLDIIIAANVLEHMTSIDPCIDGFSIKLKKGGILIVCGPTENALYRTGRFLLRISGCWQFTGDYHVSQIDQILRAIRVRPEYEETGHIHFPGPGPAALYRIVKFRKK